MTEVPIFLINGFLESGKSTLIKEVISENESYHNHSTVLIACEQGEVEYEEEWLKKYGVHCEYIEKQEDLNNDLMRELYRVYRPKRFVIEYNGFFDLSSQEFPDGFVIYQQITLIDASTFKVMYNNMKNVFSNMVKFSSLIIFNRIEGINELGSFRRNMRALNPDSQIAFEQANGQLTDKLDEDLPYDITKDTIYFEDDVYPLWYVEVFDNYEKYFNKLIRFKVFVRAVTDHSIVIGRNVMTCCAADVQFLGYELVNVPNKEDFKEGDYVFIECNVIRGTSPLSEGEVVLLDCKNIYKLPQEENKVLSMI